MKNNWKLLTIILFLSYAGSLQAQQAILSAGGNATGSGGSASYSVGQLLTVTGFGNNGSVAPGVQQPFEISVITGIDDAKEVSIHFTVYPNPLTNFLTLKIEKMDFTSMECHLYNLSGKLLDSKNITAQETIISMQEHPAGIYFLKVAFLTEEIKTFKIIKH